MNKNILDFLIENSNQYISGQTIADQLHMTRANVWKEIAKLRNQGYTIDSAPSRGYCLLGHPNILSEAAIRSHLQHASIKHIHTYDIVTSTNDIAKTLPIPQTHHEDVLIVAENQSHGRGRMGREFFSPHKNGIYISIRLMPTLSLELLQQLTLIAAVAVRNAIASTTGIESEIKWLNDLYIKGKKCCGILTEGEIVLETHQYRYVVVGIGVNVFKDPTCPESLDEIYTALSEHTQQEIDRNELVAAIVDEFYKFYQNYPQNAHVLHETYRNSCLTIGRDVLINNDPNRCVHVLDVDTNGYLVVRDAKGIVSHLNSGEVSLGGVKHEC